MRGRRKRATAQRACALLYRSPCLVSERFGPSDSQTQTRKGREERVGIPPGAEPATCPVLALGEWRAAAGIQSGPLRSGFPALVHQGRCFQYLHATAWFLVIGLGETETFWPEGLRPMRRVEGQILFRKTSSLGSEGASYRRGPRPTRRCCEFKLSANIGVEDSGGQSPLAKSRCV
jgi:hypothetical protein